MKNAIIIHGLPSREEYYSDEYPSPSNFQWLPWLQKRLLARDIYAVTPEMPCPFEPEYEAWRKEFERYDVTSETILVGHSGGAGFLVRWLSEHPSVKTNRVFLVAPWIDPDKTLSTGMFEFAIDPDLVSRTAGVVIYVSDDDDVDVHDSAQQLKAINGIHVREFVGYGHFLTSSMGHEGFPELLDDILRNQL